MCWRARSARAPSNARPHAAASDRAPARRASRRWCSPRGCVMSIGDLRGVRPLDDGHHAAACTRAPRRWPSTSRITRPSTSLLGNSMTRENARLQRELEVATRIIALQEKHPSCSPTCARRATSREPLGGARARSPVDRARVCGPRVVSSNALSTGFFPGEIASMRDARGASQALGRGARSGARGADRSSLRRSTARRDLRDAGERGPLRGLRAQDVPGARRAAGGARAAGAAGAATRFEQTEGRSPWTRGFAASGTIVSRARRNAPAPRPRRYAVAACHHPLE